MDKNKLFLGLTIAVIGLLLLLNPAGFIKIIVILLGIAAIIDGIFILAVTRNIILDPHYNKIVMIRGILSLLIGLVSVAFPLTVFQNIWTLIAYILGGYLIVSALLQLFTIFKLHRNGIMVRQSLIEVIVSLLLAAFLFVISYKKEILGYIFGALFLLMGLVIIYIVWKKRAIVLSPDSVKTVEEPQEENQESKTE